MLSRRYCSPKNKIRKYLSWRNNLIMYTHNNMTKTEIVGAINKSNKTSVIIVLSKYICSYNSLANLAPIISNTIRCIKYIPKVHIPIWAINDFTLSGQVGIIIFIKDNIENVPIVPTINLTMYILSPPKYVQKDMNKHCTDEMDTIFRSK